MTDGTAVRARVTGIANGTAYRFTVAAVNAKGIGPDSAPSNSVTTPDVPGAVMGVSAEAATYSASALKARFSSKTKVSLRVMDGRGRWAMHDVP